MASLFDAKLIKFLLVGVINTIIGAGVMFLLYNALHCSYWVSSASNYIVGGIVSYLLNKYITFQNTQKSWWQIIVFALNLIVCYTVAYILAKQVISLLLANQSKSIQDNGAMLCGLILYTGLNYIGQRLIVFKVKE